jgi:hypothetical protein
MGKRDKQNKTEVEGRVTRRWYVRSISYKTGNTAKYPKNIVNLGLTEGMCTVENVLLADTSPRLCNVTRQINCSTGNSREK